MDAQLVVNAVHRNIDDMSEFGSIIQDCVNLLSLNNSFMVVNANRRANYVAYDLTKSSVSLNHFPVGFSLHCILERLLYVCVMMLKVNLLSHSIYIEIYIYLMLHLYYNSNMIVIIIILKSLKYYWNF